MFEITGMNTDRFEHVWDDDFPFSDREENGYGDEEDYEGDDEDEEERYEEERDATIDWSQR